ncbi:hypothetical protein N7540_012676 [Penicillium herquei]|nr:hypothetical protein N7540_012676 [Penicillium herquei]
MAERIWQFGDLRRRRMKFCLRGPCRSCGILGSRSFFQYYFALLHGSCSVLLKGAIDTINLSFKPGNLLLRAGAGLKRHAVQKKFYNAWRKAKRTL